jgi:hypothetical protein
MTAVVLAALVVPDTTVFARVHFRLALLVALVMVAAFVVWLAPIMVFALVHLRFALVVSFVVVATLVMLFATIVVFAFVHFRLAVIVPSIVLPALVVFTALIVTLAFVGSTFAFALGIGLLCSEEAATDHGDHRKQERSFDTATSVRLHNLTFFGVIDP